MKILEGQTNGSFGENIMPLRNVRGRRQGLRYALDDTECWWMGRCNTVAAQFGWDMIRSSMVVRWYCTIVDVAKIYGSVAMEMDSHELLDMDLDGLRECFFNQQVWSLCSGEDILRVFRHTPQRSSTVIDVVKIHSRCATAPKLVALYLRPHGLARRSVDMLRTYVLCAMQ